MSLAAESPSVDLASPEERALRIDLAAAHRWAQLEGWSNLVLNHLTARVPGEDAFLIKPHDLTFGETTASSLIKVDLHAAGVARGQNVNRAGFAIHGAVYLARPDVQSVMHVHSSAGSAVSALAGGLKFLTQESMRFYNRIGYHEFEGVALDLEERERLAANLGGAKAMILRNHGLLACGASIPDATLNLHYLIMSCEVQLRAQATGGDLHLPPHEVCERTAQQYDRILAESGGMHEWRAMLRRLDAVDPGYRD